MGYIINDCKERLPLTEGNICDLSMKRDDDYIYYNLAIERISYEWPSDIVDSVNSYELFIGKMDGINMKFYKANGEYGSFYLSKDEIAGSGDKNEINELLKVFKPYSNRIIATPVAGWYKGNGKYVITLRIAVPKSGEFYIRNVSIVNFVDYFLGVDGCKLANCTISNVRSWMNLIGEVSSFDDDQYILNKTNTTIDGYDVPMILVSNDDECIRFFTEIDMCCMGRLNYLQMKSILQRWIRELEAEGFIFEYNIYESIEGMECIGRRGNQECLLDLGGGGRISLGVSFYK